MKHEKPLSRQGHIHGHQWHAYDSRLNIRPGCRDKIAKAGGAKAYLPSGINDIAVVLDALVVDTLIKRILNGWIIRLHKMAFCVLDDKRGLPWIGSIWI